MNQFPLNLHINEKYTLKKLFVIIYKYLKGGYYRHLMLNYKECTATNVRLFCIHTIDIETNRFMKERKK